LWNFSCIWIEVERYLPPVCGQSALQRASADPAADIYILRQCPMGIYVHLEIYGALFFAFPITCGCILQDRIPVSTQRGRINNFAQNNKLPLIDPATKCCVGDTV
jgi:hypothetical protein